MTKKTYELKYDRRAGGFFFKIIDKNGVRYEHDTTKESETELKRQGYVKYVLISYNNEGLISTEELSDICKTYGNPKN